MAGKGPTPKPDKVRRNKEVRTELEPVADPVVRELPACPFESGWIPEVEEWWATWCSSPMAGQFIDTDWFRLGSLAVLVQQWFAGQKLEAFKELRLQEAQFGATVADRLRLKWDLKQSPPAGATTPTADSVRRLRVVDAS